MTINPLGPRPGGDPRHATALKALVRAALALDETAAVMVTEPRCTEPGCPPVETVIAVLGAGEPPRQFKIFKPMADVTPADVAALMEREGVRP